MSERPDKVVILDTNVLLADPQSVLSFPTAEVVIPETVLGELDKLKTSRVDPDLRFRGREVSRLLFELSEQGNLVDGVDLPDGGTLRVAPLESDSPIPEGLSTRNADDRILSTAWQVFHDAEQGSAKVTLVTNDLNMLLKAQTLGLPVVRHGEGVEGSWARRYIQRPFQRYKIPLGILAVALAVFAAVLVIILGTRQASVSSLPSEFKSLLTASQQHAFDALTTLQQNPEDPESLLTMADFYYDERTRATQVGDAATAIDVANQGIRYYERYLDTSPNDQNARADYSALLFYAGRTDQAIQQVGVVLQKEPNNVNGNFNLGIFFWQGRRDFKQAAAQFEKVLKLSKNDQQKHGVYQQALVALEEVKADAKAAGRPIETTGGTM